MLDLCYACDCVLADKFIKVKVIAVSAGYTEQCIGLWG